jgi:hypothetical protein
MTTDGEAVTSCKSIDGLRSGGWYILPLESADCTTRPNSAATEGNPTSAQPADYALADDTDPIAVEEPQTITVCPEGVLTQAARYSRCLQGGAVNPDRHAGPFLYSTNAERIEPGEMPCNSPPSPLSLRHPASVSSGPGTTLRIRRAWQPQIPTNVSHDSPTAALTPPICR